jgi:hypothetical protein
MPAFGQDQSSELLLLAADGRCVLRQSLSPGSNSWQLNLPASLGAGIYQVMIRNPQGLAQGRLLVSR